MNLTEIFQQIGEFAKAYGVLSTVIILVIVLLIVLTYKCGPIIIQRIEKIKQDKIDKEHKKSMKVRTENITNINQILNDLREFLNGNKSYIFEYHNGGKNLSGLCFQHMTASYERNAMCETYNSVRLQNLALSLFPNLLYDLEQTDLHVINVSEAKTRYPILCNIVAEAHVKQLIFVPLHGLASPIGFVMICRNSREKLTEKEETLIQKDTQKLAILLDYERTK